MCFYCLEVVTSNRLIFDVGSEGEVGNESLLLLLGGRGAIVCGWVLGFWIGIFDCVVGDIVGLVFLEVSDFIFAL